MIDNSVLITSFFAFSVALALSFAATPVVKLFAKKVGAIDVPRDDRRMHKVPVPRLGGLAIFLGFLISFLLFGRIDTQTKSILLGAVLIVLLGVIDDIHPLKPLVKFAGQIAAALIPIFSGVVVRTIMNPFSESGLISLGVLAIPFTLVWVVGVTNAVNMIDGLDGLAVGVSSIASITVFTIAVLVSEGYIAVAMAALAGACIGFMPYNMNPAKIFMGDTGSMFLGYILATISIQGLFKFYVGISFAVPFIILGLPIFDTSFAIIRRLLKGQSPMHADRGHVHHRLIDMGFDQKQSVAILYMLSAVLGLAAVVLATSGEVKIIILAVAILAAVLIGLSVTGYEHKKEVQNKEGNGEHAAPEKKPRQGGNKPGRPNHKK